LRDSSSVAPIQIGLANSPSAIAYFRYVEAFLTESSVVHLSLF
jgi:hypothetical protein